MMKAKLTNGSLHHTELQDPASQGSDCLWRSVWGWRIDLERKTIFCIGKDLGVLRSRCDLLEASGFAAQSALFSEAMDYLQRETFDLIILSAILQEEERSEIKTFVGTATPILVVPKMIMASDLLTEVNHALNPSKTSAQ